MNRLKDEVDEPETIVDRLRGICVNKVGEYPSAEPPYKTSPIMQEAARRIEELQAEVESVNHFASMLRSECNRHRETIDSMNKQLVHCAGIALGDGVMFYADKNTRQGMLKVVPYVKGKAWKLQTGDIKLGEKPPLVLRITWREGFPSISGKALCTDVVAGNREIKFKYPKGTSFDKLAESLK